MLCASHFYRAKFSEITQISIDRAINSLEQPNKALSDAVDVRSELDLRIGNIQETLLSSILKLYLK